MHENEDIPYELVIERICRTYGKLPHEVMEVEQGWVDILGYISSVDAEAAAKRKASSLVTGKVSQRA